MPKIQSLTFSKKIILYKNLHCLRFTNKLNVIIIHPIFLSLTGRFGRVIIVAKDDDENLLRTSVWSELRVLDDIIQNTTVDFDGETFSYKDICAKWENECYTNDILNLDYILPEVNKVKLSTEGYLEPSIVSVFRLKCRLNFYSKNLLIFFN